MALLEQFKDTPFRQARFVGLGKRSPILLGKSGMMMYSFNSNIELQYDLIFKYERSNVNA